MYLEKTLGSILTCKAGKINNKRRRNKKDKGYEFKQIVIENNQTNGEVYGEMPDEGVEKIISLGGTIGSRKLHQYRMYTSKVTEPEVKMESVP